MWISKREWQDMITRLGKIDAALFSQQCTLDTYHTRNARVEPDCDPFTITCIATLGQATVDLLFGERKKPVKIGPPSKERLITFGFDGLISKQPRSMKSVSTQPDTCIERIVFFLNAPDNVRIVECTGANISGLASPGGVRFGVCDLSLTPPNRLTFTVERR